jgi:hypothetical protein
MPKIEVGTRYSLHCSEDFLQHKSRTSDKMVASDTLEELVRLNLLLTGS